MKTMHTLCLHTICLMTALTLIVGSGVFSAHADKIIVKDPSRITLHPEENSVRPDDKLVIPDDINSDNVPLGTRSTVLPEGCTTIQRKSGIYYSCKNGVYLQRQGTYYVVVERP